MELCGRPTKSGNPCKIRRDWPTSACTIHATDEDKAYRAAFMAGWKDGLKEGQKWGRSEVRAEIANEERQRATEEAEKRNFRESYNGRQVVEVDGYAYTWAGNVPLELGDRVLLPSNWFKTVPFEGKVTRLGSSYVGDLATIMRKVASREAVQV